MTDPSSLRDCLRKWIAPHVRGRPTILTADAAGSALLTRFFEDAGSSAVRSFDLTPELTMPLYRRMSLQQERLAQPLPEARTFLNCVDPAGIGVVYAGSFTAQPHFCGRRILGRRAPEHIEVERKDRQRSLTGSSAILLDLVDIESAAQKLDDLIRSGRIVISGIPDDHVALGASHTFMAAQKSSLQVILATLTAECSRALAAPLDRGVPCTFYGFVCDAWTIHFGPFEALVYWDPASGRIHAPGILWPLLCDDPDVLAAYRAVETAAEKLHRETGYRGAFCTDGVLQRNRYVAHEINPRVCAGFSLLTEMSASETSLSLVDLALRDFPASQRDLRALLLEIRAQVQGYRPVVCLWDSAHRALQDALRARAARCASANEWVNEVLQSLGDASRAPLSTRFRDGA
jgi:hypothetical protein